MHKIILFILFVTNVFAYELNVELTVPKENNTQSMSDQDLLIRGKEEAIKEYLKGKNYDQAKFEEKLNLKKNSKTRYDELLNTVFTDTNIYFLSDLNAKNFSKAVFRGNLDETKFDDFYFELVNDLETLAEKKVFYQLDIELQNSLTWLDIVVYDSALFKNTILNSWNEVLRKFIIGYTNIEVVDDKFKLAFDKFPKKINLDSALIEVKVLIKKTSENSISKKATFEINAQYLILKSATKEVIYSFNYPIQKKELQIANKKDLNSTLATLIFNLVKVQAPSIGDALKKSESQIELAFNLKGQELFSDVSKAKSMLDTYLLDLEAKLEIKQLSLTNSIISIKIDQDKKERLVEKLKTAGKIPLSQSPNEQKFLVLTGDNNSFAIVKKD